MLRHCSFLEKLSGGEMKQRKAGADLGFGWEERLCQTIEVAQAELDAGVGHVHLMEVG